MTSSLMPISTTSITSTPYTISSFAYNTFICNAGSSVINLPVNIAIGYTFQIINNDTTTKTINNGLINITLQQSTNITFFGNSITNTWQISDTGVSNALPIIYTNVIGTGAITSATGSTVSLTMTGTPNPTVLVLIQVLTLLGSYTSSQVMFSANGGVGANAYTILIPVFGTTTNQFYIFTVYVGNTTSTAYAKIAYSTTGIPVPNTTLITIFN
jgi:hypothetical protein